MALQKAFNVLGHFKFDCKEAKKDLKEIERLLVSISKHMKAINKMKPIKVTKK